jgi:hypothetical protein
VGSEMFIRDWETIGCSAGKVTTGWSADPATTSR